MKMPLLAFSSDQNSIRTCRSLYFSLLTRWPPLPLSATIAPSSTRQLASPAWVKPSRLLPSNRVTKPSFPVAAPAAASAETSTTDVSVAQRVMNVLPVVIFVGEAQFGSTASQRLMCRSKLLHFDLAEHDHALAELQRDPSFRKLAVVGAVHGLHAVERDGELRALRDDVVGVPLAAGLEHRRGLGGVDDGTRAVARVGSGVENVDLVGA